ncbi:MAG: ComF family protein [Magnetococcales bacterium]|nr:ComF family protein [Magnetococcales bacterium]
MLPQRIQPAALRLWCRCLNLMFPPVCPFCDAQVAQNGRLCEVCRSALPKQPDHYCLRCGQRAYGGPDGCLRCLNKAHAPNRFVVGYLYQSPLREQIHRFKYRDTPELSKQLGALGWTRMASQLRSIPLDIVVPLPLHNTKLIQRRFNQSALLAGCWAKNLKIPMVTNGLQRFKMTQSQASLTARQRRDNVRGAFRADSKQVSQRRILLVDDVMTTGATALAAVQALKRAGACSVTIACLALAIPDRADDAVQGGKHHAKH